MSIRDDAIAAVDKYAELNALAVSEANATPLRAEIADLKGQRDAAVAERDKARQDYADHMATAHQAPPPPPPPPPPPASKTLVGLSLGATGGTDQQKLATAEGAMGRVHVIRHFYSGDIGSFASVKSWTVDRALVVSYKSASLTAAKAFMKATDVRTWITVNHEPENDPAGAAWAPEYRGRIMALKAAAAEVGNPKVTVCQILMGWTLDPKSGRKLADWLVPGVLHGWDLYNAAWDKGVYTAPEERFARCVTASGSDGFAIAEWGSQMAKGDDGTKRAQWITACDAYFKKSGAAFHTYWNATFGANAPDFRLTDQPSQSAYRNAMASPVTEKR